MTAIIDHYKIKPVEGATPEKMSKSRGNVITIDEVVGRISSISPGFEIRDHHNNIIDNIDRLNLWRDKDRMIFCGSKWNCLRKHPGFEILGQMEITEHSSSPVPVFSHIPVFLHKTGNPIPVTYELENGKILQQHPFAIKFWNRMYAEYPDEFEDIPDSHPFFTVRTNRLKQPIDAGIYSAE